MYKFLTLVSILSFAFASTSFANICDESLEGYETKIAKISDITGQSKAEVVAEVPAIQELFEITNGWSNEYRIRAISIEDALNLMEFRVKNKFTLNELRIRFENTVRILKLRTTDDILLVLNSVQDEFLVPYLLNISNIMNSISVDSLYGVRQNYPMYLTRPATLEDAIRLEDYRKVLQLPFGEFQKQINATVENLELRNFEQVFSVFVQSLITNTNPAQFSKEAARFKNFKKTPLFTYDPDPSAAWDGPSQYHFDTPSLDEVLAFETLRIKSGLSFEKFNEVALTAIKPFKPAKLKDVIKILNKRF